MKFASVSAWSFLIAGALGADCYGQPNKGLTQYADAYWEARQKMCSNSDCDYQKDCTTSGSKTVPATIPKGTFKTTAHASFKRQKLGGSGGFKNCWDATENIINQCVYGSNQMGGVWAANGQLYELSSYIG